MRHITFVVLCGLCGLAALAEPIELDNGTLSLTLQEDAIAISWSDGSGNVVQGTGHGKSFQTVDHDIFKRAESVETLENGIEVVHVVDLAPQGSTLRFHARMTNTGYTAQPVTAYPISSGDWVMPGRSDAIRWWDALTFVQQDRALTNGT